jgi:hypothetical protein
VINAQPTFERTADATLDTTRATYAQRGGEYGDSWSLENMVATFTEHTLKAIGNDRSPAAIRLLVMAALVDVKDSRMTGPWKMDSLVDGVAYRACYGTLREEYEAAKLNAARDAEAATLRAVGEDQLPTSQ